MFASLIGIEFLLFHWGKLQARSTDTGYILRPFMPVVIAGLVIQGESTRRYCGFVQWATAVKSISGSLVFISCPP
jgi:EamA domain-containing membrane protein RarD